MVSRTAGRRVTTRIVLVAGIAGMIGFATTIVGVIVGAIAIDAALAGIAASLGAYLGALAVGAWIARLPPRSVSDEPVVAVHAAPPVPARRWEPHGALLH